MKETIRLVYQLCYDCHPESNGEWFIVVETEGNKDYFETKTIQCKKCLKQLQCFGRIV